MKLRKILFLLAGILIFSLGYILSGTVTEEMKRSMLANGALALQIFGAVTFFWGLIGSIFYKKLSQWCNWKTTAVAIVIAAVVGLGLWCCLSVLSCFILDASPKQYPIRFPVSCVLGCICLYAFAGLLYLYYRLRRKQPSVPGVILEVLLSLSYCIPFFYICFILIEIASAML